jgi:CheY-like chemotaxis protein
VHDDPEVRGEVERTLSEDFEVATYEDPVAALVHVGAEAPDALVTDAHVGGLEAARMAAELKRAEPTRHVRTVVYSTDDSGKQTALDSGAYAFVARPDTKKLRETLAALLGTER